MSSRLEYLVYQKSKMSKKRGSEKMENYNNTGRSFSFVRMTFVLSIILLIFANAIQLSYAKEKDSVNLYLDISFDSNLIFNKYDVSIELDGERLDTVEYGLYYTKLCKVTPGKHVVRAYKDEDSEVMGEKNFQLEEDMTFQCQLNTKRKEIEFEEVKIFKGTAGHSIDVPDCVGFHLVDALEVLRQKGFVNYCYEGKTEEKIKEKTWAVDVQNVKVGDKIDKNDEIILTCVPAEEYIKKTFAGLTYSDAIEKAKAIGYKKVQKNDIRHKEDEPVGLKDGDISDEAKQYWIVKSAEDNYSDDYKLVLNFDYNVPMPDLSKVKLEKADNQLQSIQQGHFSYRFIGYKTGDSISHENYKKYYIIEQSEEPGTIIKYKSEITFKCKKTKAAKEAEKKARAAKEAKKKAKAAKAAEKKAAAAAAAAKKAAEEKATEPMVWISGSGKCYHSKQSCSNMRDPWQVPLSKAQSMHRKACSKCY